MSQILVTGEAKIRDIQGPVVANSGVITALDGAASQYVRGDGTLADFPTSSGGGSSVSYYLNSSVSQGTIGGVAYRELSKDPIIGAGTDIAISSNGYVANYITDVNDPDVTIVAGGNFNCEFYFSVNNDTGNPFTYAELYKYDGTTFTLLGSSVGVPEYINQGTIIAPYYFAIPVATATLALTDRLAIRIYVNVDGRTVTLHTENGHLCQVVTTLSKGMVSLNNLTDQSQFLTTGTAGTNFAIASTGDTHTFNLPVASATNTGKLSSTDWSTFNNKQNTITDPITGTGASTQIAYFNSGTSITSEASFNYDASTNRLGVNTSVPNATIGANAGTDSGYSLLVKNDNSNYNGIGFATDSTYGNLIATEKLGTALTRNLTLLNQSGYVSLTEAGNLGVGILTPNTGLDIYNGTSAYLWLHTANSGITGTDGVRLALFSTNGANLRNYEGAFSITAEGDFSIITIGAENFRVNSADGSIYQSKVANAMLKSVSGVITAAVAGTDYVLPSALTGYVPTSRTLTINGTAYDLSADRSWTVGTMGGSGVSGRVAYYDGTNSITSEAGFIYDSSTNRLGVNTTVPNATIGADSALDSGYGLLIKTGSSNYNGIGIAIDSTYGNLISTEKLGSASARNLTLLNQSGFVSLTESGNLGLNVLTPAVSGNGIDIYGSTSVGLRFHTATSGTTVSDGAGINFSAANNLGITNYEAGTIDIVTNGNSGVFIDSSGNVGIKGATPSSALTVNGAITQSSVTSAILKANASGTLVAAVAGTDYQIAISLTTTGSSGSSSYNSSTGVLNVPTYTLSGLGGQPLSGDLTAIAALNTTNYGRGFLTLNNEAEGRAKINAQELLTNPVTGTGTTNYLPKFTGSTTIGNSAITDDGTTVTLISRALSGTSATFSGSLNANGVMSLGNDGTYGSTYKTLGLTGNTDGTHRIFAGTSDDLYIAAATSRGIQFWTNGVTSTKMSIATNGDTTIIGVAPILAIQSNTTGNIFLRFRQSADTMASMFYTNATATFTMSNNMGGLRFNTSGTTDAMNISSAGFVGIGTTDPTNILTIKNNLAATNGIDFQSYASSSVQGRITFNQADDTFNIVNTSAYAAGGIVFKTNSTEKVRISTAGEMLVLGTYNPLALANRGNITLNGTNSNILVFANNSSIRGYIFHNTTDMEIFNKANGNMSFFTNDTERMRIASNGTVDIRANSNNVSGMNGLTVRLGSNCDNTSSYGYVLETGGGNRCFIYGNGNIVNSNNSYGLLSDIKLKENIVDATPKLDKLMKVRIVNYNLIGSELTQIGVVAQELEQVFAGLIDEHPDRDSEGVDLGTKTKSVKMSVFVPMLIKAMQEQQAQIEELKELIKNK